METKHWVCVLNSLNYHSSLLEEILGDPNGVIYTAPVSVIEANRRKLFLIEETMNLIEKDHPEAVKAIEDAAG